MAKKEKRAEVVKALKKSYNMELETVINYLANSVHLDGLRAEEVRRALAEDIQEELGHAQQLADRIKTLESGIPGSFDLKMEQKSMQPPKDMTDVVAVIKGVIEAEEGAIDQYQKIIEMTDGVDYVTQDLCIQLLGEEEKHRREFKSFLTEYQKS